MSLKIVIACGGTGGHLFPGIAVAQAAQARGHQCIVLISEKQIDALASDGHDDLRFEKLPAIAMPKLFSLKMIPFVWKFFKTTRACKKLLQEFKADVVLGMGGFTSLPPLYAGRKMKLKTLLHESNAFPGKANRMSAKFCDLVLLGLGEAASHFPAAKTSVVGTPLRSALRGMGVPPISQEQAKPTHAEPLKTGDADGSVIEARGQNAPATAYAHFQLQPGVPVLLVMGGSQGARGVNDAVLAALPQLDPQALQIIHLTGPKEIEAVRTAYAGTPFNAHVAPFCQRMELAYAIATVCISRAGASSLTELSAFGLPTLLIPYPFAADDHQTKNAEVFVRAKAALMVQERDLTGPRLATILNDLLTHTEVRQSLSTNMSALGHLDAAERVCSAMEGLLA